MTLSQSILLGVMQGLTEFLPVSSSGHLAILQHFFGIEGPVLFFDVMLHVGTLAAILVYFRKDLARLIMALGGREPEDAGDDTVWSGTRADAWRFVAWVALATVPAAAAGVLFEDKIKSAFAGVLVAAVCLIVNGGVLFFASRAKDTGREAHTRRWPAAAVVGIAQAIALLPGISRSGSTISAGLLTGMGRAAAARFSFFLAIPIILGAAAKTYLDVLKAGTKIEWATTITATTIAFAIGLGALYILIGLVRRGNLKIFAYYCWFIAAVTIIFNFIK